MDSAGCGVSGLLFTRRAEIRTRRPDPASKRPVAPRCLACELANRNRRIPQREFSLARNKLAFRLSDSTAMVWMAEARP
jgi:hypothetical protein